jgi:RND superfamily putative drug exporter
MSESRRKPRRQRIAAGLRTTRARFRALDRRDRVSLMLFLALIGVLGVFRAGAESRMHPTDAVVAGSDSAKAAELSDRAFGREQNLLVLLQGPRQRLDDQGPAIAERIAQLPDHRVLDPWRAGGSALRPKPGQAVLVIGVNQSFEEVANGAAPRLRELLHDVVKPPLKANMTGFTDLNHGIHEQTELSAARSRMLAAPVLVLILLLVFGSPIAAGMPLFLGGCVAVAAGGTLDLINRYVTPLELTSITLGAAMGLALGVDYSLLLVARFRRALAAGASVREASEIAAERAGRTVKFAGVVLAVAMLTALVATPADVLKSATAGVLVAVVLSLFGAIVALPPLLRWAGHDINRYQVVRPGAESGRWSRLALTALRRPTIAVIIVMGAILALSAPALGLETGPPDPRVLPEDAPERVDFDVIERELGGSGALPFVVTVVADRGTLADKRLDTLAAFERELARDPGTDKVLGPATVARRTAALAAVPDRLRAASSGVRGGAGAAGRLERGLAEAADGADVLVGGLSAAADGSSRLNAGGSEAERAAAQIGAGMEDARRGAAALHGGLALARDGARALERGSGQASDGADTIARNLAQVARETRAAAPGAAELANGLEQGAQDLRRLKEPADLANEKAAEALDALNQMLPTSKGDPSYARAYEATATVVGALSGRNPITGLPVREGYPGLPEALAQAAAQTDRAADGADELRRGVERLGDGLGRLAAGATDLADGVDRLAAGNAALADGAGRLLAGARQLEGGMATLAGGTGQLLGGIAQLNAGSGRLANELGAGALRAAPLVVGLDALHSGAQVFGTRTAELEKGLGDSRRLAPLFESGFAKIAAIETAPASQRAAAAWAINYDRGGTAVHYLVTQKASYAQGAAVDAIPSRADNPYRDRLEERVDEMAGRIGATAGVGGPGPTLADFNGMAKDSLPGLVILLVLVTYLVLVPILRSLVLPLIAVVLNVLTLLAAFGVLALGFGPGAPLGGPGFVDDIVVMIVVAVTFALSIDYAVFILDRMREGFDQTRTVEGAIAYGIEGTAGVITGAAAIIAGAFLTFTISPVIALRQIGVGLTVAIVLDATLIRLVLLPAALRLVGERAWHTPRWLERVSRPLAREWRYGR